MSVVQVFEQCVSELISFLLSHVIVNGQTEDSDRKVKKESDKMKDVKTSDSKMSKKKEKTPRKETNKVV